MICIRGVYCLAVVLLGTPPPTNVPHVWGQRTALRFRAGTSAATLAQPCVSPPQPDEVLNRSFLLVKGLTASDDQ